MKTKKRLDLLVNHNFSEYTRKQIQDLIMQGKVSVDGVVNTKAGSHVAEDAVITIHPDDHRYVSRAGYKLEKALDVFGLSVEGLTALDAGISTGGFTDCLLQRGAKKVYGVDVGHGQIHEKIRQDPRVMVHEKTNLRNLSSVGELVDLVTLDLSFISVLKVVQAVVALMKADGKMIVLIKPQFEAGPGAVGKQGVIKNIHVHDDVVRKVTHGVEQYGFTLAGVVDSPLAGTAGNKEFLALFVRT